MSTRKYNERPRSRERERDEERKINNDNWARIKIIIRIVYGLEERELVLWAFCFFRNGNSRVVVAAVERRQTDTQTWYEERKKSACFFLSID